MQIILAAVLSLVAFSAQANEDKWSSEISEYAAGLPARSTGDILLGIIAQGSKTVVSCPASAATVTAVVVADTFPVAGAFSEVIANLADENYQTIEDFWSWQTLADGGRGAAGGATVAAAEAVEFVFLWLLGDEDRSFQGTKKVYESSYVAFKEFFAKDAACLGSIAKITLLYNELQVRRNAGQADPSQPITLP